MPLIEISDLCVSNRHSDLLLNHVSLSLHPGVPLLVIGETGSGKSLIAQALFGLLPHTLSPRGRLRVQNRPVDLSDRNGLRQFWGSELFLLPQEPRLALDPTMKTGRQIVEGSKRGSDPHHVMDAVELQRAASSHYPHMLSGGMAQRALVACALHRDAGTLVADEPTKGLDVPRVARVVETLRTIAAMGRSLLIITHDLDVVRSIPGDIAVLRSGVVIERGKTAEVLANPNHHYTRDLIAAEPGHWPRRGEVVSTAEPAIAARNLTFYYDAKVPLVEKASIEIAKGEIIGLAGPSGCGKTTFGNLLLRLQQPRSGTVEWSGRDVTRDRDAAKELRQRYQKLHQDPASTFVRHRTIRQQFIDLAEIVSNWSLEAVLLLMERMKLHEKLLDRLPSEISGGEAQRFAIARVIALRPDFILADEPTSRLDPIVQRDVLTMFRDICAERSIGSLLISHHVAMLDAVAHRTIDFHALSANSATNRARAELSPLSAIDRLGG